MKIKFIITILLVLFISGNSIKAETSINNAKAMFIYNFLSHIVWPNSNSSTTYTIGVIGKTPVFKNLQSYTKNRTVGSKSIVIVQYNSIAEIKNCEVLLVATDKSNNMGAILKQVGESPCLIIGENSGAINSGALIDFTVVDGKLKYKIDKNNVTSKNLYVSSALLKMSM